MELEAQTGIPQPPGKAEAPSFGSLAWSVWGLFGLMVLSGVFLAVHYIPAFGQAFASVERLNGEVPFGWMVRRIHGAGGSLLLLLLVIHLLRIFYTGSYKRRSGFAWSIEVLCVFSALWINFTGSFLPLSQAAYWEKITILSNLSSLPWAGGFLAEFLRGGKEIGGTALSRFHSMHIGFSALMALLLFLHYRMGIKAGLDRNGPRPSSSLLPLLVVTGVLLAVIPFMPDWFIDSLKKAADPTLNPERVSFPWYLLFVPETLPLMSGTYPFLTVLLPLAVLLVLFVLPKIDRNPERGLLRRPFAMALCAAFLVSWVYFSLIGTANAHYGERVIVPERSLSAAELRGAEVFAEKNCAYCHQVAGREGRRQGPDMTVVTERGRSRDWVQRFVYNARLYQPGTAMPRYEVPLEDLEALSAYLLSLDGRKEKFKAMNRSHLRENRFYIEFRGEGK